MYYVGIDIAKSFHVVSVIDDEETKVINDLIKKTGVYFYTFSYNSPDNNQLNSASNFYSIHDVS